MRIEPVNQPGDFRQSSIEGYNVKDINTILGFEPNTTEKDDPGKVWYSWGFTVDGERCGIWDFNGSYRSEIFSWFGPLEIKNKLFPCPRNNNAE